jgi:hypothetical protein
MTENEGFTETAEPEQATGEWLSIAFMGHNEYTGYVTEIVKNGQPAYHVDLPEKLWGGNPLACVEYAATAWFSDHPVTEEFVRRAWEAFVRAAEKRRQQEAEWRRADEQRALTAGGRDEDSDPDEDLDDGEGAAWVDAADAAIDAEHGDAF